MIDFTKIKVGDRVAVNAACSYCSPGSTGIQVYAGDVGTVHQIFTDKNIIESGWPLDVRLDGHPYAYLFGLDELDHVEGN